MRTMAMTAFRLLPGPLRRLAVRLISPSFTVGAVVVLQRPDRRVLMVEQRHSAGWAFPGGLLRHGEGAAEAAVRELGEEVNVELIAGALPAPLAAVNPRVRRVDLVYLVPVGAQLAVNRGDTAEVTQFAWRDVSDMDDADISEPTREMLRAVRLC